MEEEIEDYELAKSNLYSIITICNSHNLNYLSDLFNQIYALFSNKMEKENKLKRFYLKKVWNFLTIFSIFELSRRLKEETINKLNKKGLIYPFKEQKKILSHTSFFSFLYQLEKEKKSFDSFFITLSKLFEISKEEVLLLFIPKKQFTHEAKILLHELRREFTISHLDFIKTSYKEESLDDVIDRLKVCLDNNHFTWIDLIQKVDMLT